MTAMHKALGVAEPLSVEAYALKFNRLHPDVELALGPFFPSGMRMSQVRVEVHPREWSRFGQSGRGAPTPTFTTFGTLYVAAGFLNRPGRLWTNTCDLANETGEGWETLAHEVFHVWQYQRAGALPTALSYIGGVLRSLWANVAGKRTWNHAVIPFEQEAIAFASDVRAQVVKRAAPAFWRKWKEIG